MSCHLTESALFLERRQSFVGIKVLDLNSGKSPFEKYITRYGLRAIFTMAVLPFPGFLYTIAGYVGRHYGIPYRYYFLAGFGGRLLRNVIYTIGVLYMLNRTGWLK